MKAREDDIRRLQFEAAGCTNELLEISEDIGRYVIPSYTQPDIFMLQSRIQSERLIRLNSSLESIHSALETLLSSPAGSPCADDAAVQEIKTSASITLQIIDQNLAVSNEKLLLLKEMQISCMQAEEAYQDAKKLADTAQILNLRNSLAELSGK